MIILHASVHGACAREDTRLCMAIHGPQTCRSPSPHIVRARMHRPRAHNFPARARSTHHMAHMHASTSLALNAAARTHVHNGHFAMLRAVRRRWRVRMHMAFAAACSCRRLHRRMRCNGFAIASCDAHGRLRFDVIIALLRCRARCCVHVCMPMRPFP